MQNIFKKIKDSGLVGKLSTINFNFLGSTRGLRRIRDETERTLDQRRGLVKGWVKEYTPDGTRLRKKIAVAGNKGGVGKTTTKKEVLAATYELTQGLNLRIVGIDGDTSGSNIGNHFSEALKDMPGREDDVPYLKFFRTQSPDGKEGDLLMNCLYELPDHPGLFLAAVPEVEALKDALGQYSDKEHFNKLSKAFAQLDADFTFVDLAPGKNKDQILDFWNTADVRVLSFGLQLEAVKDAVGLVETSQRYHVQSDARAKRDTFYRTSIKRLEDALSESNEALRYPQREIERISPEVQKLRSQVKEYEQKKQHINTQITAIESVYSGDNQNDESKKRIETLIAMRDELIEVKCAAETTLNPLEANLTQLSDRVNELRARIAGYETQEADLERRGREELIKIDRYRSVNDIVGHMNDVLKEEGQSGSYRYSFNDSPIVVVPNIVEPSEINRALRAYDAVRIKLGRDGFLGKKRDDRKGEEWEMESVYPVSPIQRETTQDGKRRVVSAFYISKNNEVIERSLDA